MSRTAHCHTAHRIALSATSLLLSLVLVACGGDGGGGAGGGNNPGGRQVQIGQNKLADRGFSGFMPSYNLNFIPSGVSGRIVEP